jgi:hypothetical protein
MFLFASSNELPRTVMSNPSATACQPSLSIQNLHSKATGAMTGRLTACMMVFYRRSFWRREECGE